MAAATHPSERIVEGAVGEARAVASDPISGSERSVVRDRKSEDLRGVPTVATRERPTGEGVQDLTEAPNTTTEAPPTTTVPDDDDDEGEPQGTSDPDDDVPALAITGSEVDGTALLGSIVTAIGMMCMGLARRLREPEWY